MENRRQELWSICSVLSITMAVVIILLASACMISPRLDKVLLEILFVCGSVENAALAVRYLSAHRKRGWTFLLVAFLLAGSAFLIFI